MNYKTRLLVRAAIIAALYAVLTHLQNLLLPGSASWAIQCRLSEALCVLALFTPAAVSGLSIGCLLFNIGFAELLLILLIAFVVVGPKDLPKVARALGRFVRYIRNMIEEVKRESGLDEVEKEFKNIERKVDEGVRAVDIRPDLQKTQLQINKELNAIKKDVSFKDFKSNLGGKKS